MLGKASESAARAVTESAPRPLAIVDKSIAKHFAVGIWQIIPKDHGDSVQRILHLLGVQSETEAERPLVATWLQPSPLKKTMHE